MKPDLHSRLRDIAAGRIANDLPNSLSTSVVEKHSTAFRAWANFARSQSGEPLTAPAELLPPLS